jgi:hypothetical protein
MATILDHIIIVAPTLAAGATYVRSELGVEPQRGGSHPRMGTHNLLLSLGESTYLEIISADPAAPKPSRPRWFALDALSSDSPPRLAAWVVRTRDIYATSACCNSVVGNVEPMSRGALSWLITVTPDGGLPLGGAAPALIEWPVDSHPAQLLTNVGCSLVKLEVHHPDPHRVSAILASIGLAPPLLVQQSESVRPFLVAHIRTPHGFRTLSHHT